MSLFLLMKTKDDILKNVGEQTVDGSYRNSVGCISHSFPFIYNEWGLELLSFMKGLKSTIKNI